MNKNETNNLMAGVGKFFTWILTYIMAIFVKGTVLVSLWNWFISPLGVTQITFWLAIGISMTALFLAGIGSNKEANKDKKFGEYIKDFVAASCAHLIIWGMAAIVHLFV